MSLQYLGLIDYSHDFFVACQDHDISKINFIIKLGTFNNHIHRQSFDYNWGLSGACQGGHVILVAQLLRKGASNINFALECAAIGNKTSVLLYFVQKAQQNPEQYHFINWERALNSACCRGNLEVVTLIITLWKSNILVLQSVSNGLTYACLYDHGQVIEYILEQVMIPEKLLDNLIKNCDQRHKSETSKKLKIHKKSKF